MTIGPGRGSLSCIVVGLLALLSLGAAVPSSKQGFLGWSDAKFWAESSELDGKALEPFEASELDVLLLDGPKRAQLRQRHDVPLVAIRGVSLRENSTISLEERGVLVTSRLEGDETVASRAFRQPNKSRQPNKRSDPEPQEDPASLPEGRAVNLFHFVLSDQIPEVASHSGTWSTVLLLFDKRSNQVVTQVDAKPGRKSQTAGQSAQSSRIQARIHAANHPYRARPDSPALPVDRSIVLASANTIEQAPGRAWLMRGSFLLPALDHDVVGERPGHDVGDEATLAVLPVTIVLTGDHDATPILVPLHVPIYRPLEGTQGQPLARGHFAVDLLALVGDQLAPQTYAVWAMSRQHVSEPIVVRVTQP